MTTPLGNYPTGLIENNGIDSNLQTYVFTGKATKVREWTVSSVSGGGASSGTVVGNSVLINSNPIQTRHDHRIEFWLQHPETGEEMVAQLDSTTVALHEQHVVSLIYSRRGNNIHHRRLVNHSLGYYYRPSTSAASYIYATLAGKIFFLTLAIFIGAFFVRFPEGSDNLMTAIIILPILSYIYMHFRRWEVNRQLDELALQLLEKRDMQAKPHGTKARMIYALAAVSYLFYLVFIARN